MGWSSALTEWPVLETERLILRRLRMEDAPDVFEYASDPDVTRFVMFETQRSPDETRTFLERVLSRGFDSGILTFAITLRGTGKVVGTCGIFLVDERHARAEAAYALNQAYWGRGIATEALRAVIDLGFSRLGLNRIAALAMLDNPASTRVMEKAGMQYEGILREYMMIKGRYHDLKSYSILRKEWEGGSR